MSENIIENLLNNLLQDRNLRGYSSKWANWKSQLTIYTCKFCIERTEKLQISLYWITKMKFKRIQTVNAYMFL